MPEIHIINREIFEISCSEPGQAFSIQKQVENQLQFKVHRIMEEVFHESMTAQKVLRIERLEIDLGEIAYDELNECLPQKFSEKLMELWTSRYSGRQICSIPEPASYFSDNLLLIKHFLLMGGMPWWASRSGSFSIDAVMEILLAERRDELRSLLETTMRNHRVIERIVYQFNEHTIKRIIGLWGLNDLQIGQVKDKMTSFSQHLSKVFFRQEAKQCYYVILRFLSLNFKVLPKEQKPGLFDPSIQTDQVVGPEQTLFERLLHVLTGDGVWLREQISVQNKPKDIPDTSTEVPESWSAKDGKAFIQNAGLILVAAFFPALFKELQWLTDDGFVNRESQVKALFLLHYLSTGETEAPEYTLQLNKILCGLPLEESIPSFSELSENEKHEARQLLEDIISHWRALKNSSPEGLQGSFLLRDGLLSYINGHWLLQVQRIEGFDFLLNEISWSWKTIKLSWMETYIEVEW